MLKTFADADEFLRAVGPTLEEHEAEHHLLLGVATALQGAKPSVVRPFFAAVSDGSGLALAALLTPARPLLLASDRDEIETALEQLWEGLTATGQRPEKVLGTMHHADAFVSGWQRRTGCATGLSMRQRLYVVTDVRDVPMVPGALRQATVGDHELVADWRMAFVREAFGESSADGEREIAKQRIAAGDVFLWADDEPRSMAGRARPTTRGIAINAVYTPPECRGRGYATACVAALSARLLDEGRQFCVLYTDLANPTSNAIYTRIGYQPVRDFALYSLTAD